MSITVNGVTQMAAIASDGSFSSSFDSHAWHAASYSVTFHYAGDANFASPTDGTSSLLISPYAFAYQIVNDNETYGKAANLAADLGTTINTSVNGQSLAITYVSTGDTTTAHVLSGGYAITGSLANGGGLTSDYSVTLKNGTLTVNPFAFTYQIGNDTQTYGTAANLATALGTTINTGVDAQNLDIAYSSTGNVATAPVGTYSIAGIVSNGTGMAGDYIVTLNSGTLTVNKATLTVTAVNASRLYGVANPTLTDTITGYVNGQNSSVVSGSPVLSTTATTTSPVGSYPITVALGTLSDFQLPIRAAERHPDGQPRRHHDHAHLLGQSRRLRPGFSLHGHGDVCRGHAGRHRDLLRQRHRAWHGDAQ